MFVTYVVLKMNRISPPGRSMTAATCWGAQKMLSNFKFIVKQWRGHPMRFNRCTSVFVLSPASYTCGFANAFLFCVKTTFPNSRWLPVSITAQGKLVEVIAFFPSAFPFILSAVSCWRQKEYSEVLHSTPDDLHSHEAWWLTEGKCKVNWDHWVSQ